MTAEGVVIMDIELVINRGTCATCGCTDTNACVTPGIGACHWANEEETLCSACQAAEVEYDRWGRMKYHPDYHARHLVEYTTKELSYLCKQYYRGNVKTLAASLERTETAVRQRVCELRKEGKFDYYKSMEVI